MEGNNLFCENQGGFRRGRSTISTTCFLLDFINSNRNNNQYVAMVYIDLKKAFNTVNHDILIKKMAKLGFSDKFIRLLESYLTDRSQKIKLGETMSSSQVIHDGVPQGSIVGPSLFLCYINDLKHVRFDGYLSLYADDTSISVAAATVEELVFKMNQNLEIFYNWCLVNKLSINIKKTKVLPYYSARQKNFLEDHVIKINKQALEQVKVYTYLGIRLDSNLSMKNHLDHLHRAALPMLYSLANIRKFIDTRTAVLVFKAHILSRLEYGSALCVGANNLHVERLQKLVNKSLRICFYGARDANVVDMHLKARILPLKVRRNIALMKIMYGRILNERNSISVNKSCTRTRGSIYPRLEIPFPKSESFRRSVTYQGPARWLALPNKLKLYESLEEFSKNLKEWYIAEFVQCGTM